MYFEGDPNQRQELTVREAVYGMPGEAIATLKLKGNGVENDEGFRKTIGMLMRDPITGKPRSERAALCELQSKIANARSVADGVLKAVKRSEEIGRRFRTA